MRWRDQFEERKGTKDRALMQTLVSRAEARDQVYDSPALLNHAVHIASKHAASTSALRALAACLVLTRAYLCSCNHVASARVGALNQCHIY